MFYIHLSYIFTYVLWYSSSINWWLAFLKQRLKVYLDLVIFSISDSNDNLFPKFTILPKSIDPFRSSVFIWLFDSSDVVRYLLFLYFYTWEIQRMLNMLMYVSKIQIKVKIKIKYPPFIISNILKCPTYSCRVLFWFVVVFYARILLLFSCFLCTCRNDNSKGVHKITFASIFHGLY